MCRYCSHLQLTEADYFGLHYDDCHGMCRYCSHLQLTEADYFGLQCNGFHGMCRYCSHLQLTGADYFGLQYDGSHGMCRYCSHLQLTGADYFGLQYDGSQGMCRYCSHIRLTEAKNLGLQYDFHGLKVYVDIVVIYTLTLADYFGLQYDDSYGMCRYRISGNFRVRKFRRKLHLERVLNFHRVLFSLFQGLSMKAYCRVYFSLCLLFAI